ncbi:MAG: metallophosphoesterase [Kineosporiaceae bacterium]
MIRVAAVGDVHLAPEIAGRHRAGLADLAERADVLLLAGDLTRHGTVEEARVVAEEYRGLAVPVIAVLGNHDHHGDAAEQVTAILTEAGITVLEGDGVVLDVGGTRLGVAGAKGFGLGFAGRCGSEFGEPEMKAFTRHGRLSAHALSQALESVADADVRIALTHYAPVDDTLVGEPPEIWPFLGNYLLGEAVDAHGCALAVHGHAHAGTEKGVTDGGVRVRNVAQPVLGAAYALYVVDPAVVDVDDAHVRDVGAAGDRGQQTGDANRPVPASAAALTG